VLNSVPPRSWRRGTCGGVGEGGGGEKRKSCYSVNCWWGGSSRVEEEEGKEYKDKVVRMGGRGASECKSTRGRPSENGRYELSPKKYPGGSEGIRGRKLIAFDKEAEARGRKS